MAFNVIGVGPGDSELMTLKAVRLIGEADVIIVPVKREGGTKSTALTIAKPYIKDMSRVVCFHFPMVMGFEEDKATQVLFRKHGQAINHMLDKNQSVVFLTLGDPSIYSTITHIRSYVREIAYVPGIPSFIQGAALAKESLVIGDESLCVVNMTDEEDAIREKFRIHESIVVMKVNLNRPLLKKLINESNRRAIFMSNIGLEGEQITEDIGILDEKMPYFTIALIR